MAAQGQHLAAQELYFAAKGVCLATRAQKESLYEVAPFPQIPSLWPLLSLNAEMCVHAFCTSRGAARNESAYSLVVLDRLPDHRQEKLIGLLRRLVNPSEPRRSGRSPLDSQPPKRGSAGV